MGGGEAAQLLSDRLMDAVDICQDFVIPKPQNAISLVLQEPTSLGLAGRQAVVLPPSISTINRAPLAHKVGHTKSAM